MILRKFILLFAILCSCTPVAYSQTPAQRKPNTVPTHANVILITIDTLRADHLGCYGGKFAATPAIDQLAHDGVVYERAIAQVPLTWPSHAAILTGTYPFQNGVQDFTSPPLDPSFQTIAQGLKRHGYQTGAVVSSFVLDRSFGLARGFDFYDDAFPASSFHQAEISLVERNAGESVERALRWLKNRKAAPRPFFFWLHLYDAHSPYHSPEPFASQYKDRPYDGAIAYVDSQLARFFAALRSSGIYDKSLIVLVSDHGESLGEHGEREHGYFIYQATTRVPLIVKFPSHPGFARRSGRVTRPVETVAIPGSILKFLQLKDDIQRQFQSADLFNDTDSTSSAYSETFYPFSSFGWSPLHSLQSGRYHYIDAPEPELYDLATDPSEKENIFAKQPAIASVLKQALAEREQKSNPAHRNDSNPQLSPDAVAKLRSLGYMAYRLPVSAEQIKAGLADPKAKLAEFNTILRATDLFHLGRYQEGAALLDPIRQSDPQMYLVPFMLGEAALQQQDWPTAKQQLEASLKLNPTFDQAMTGLAKAYFELNNLDSARIWLKKALAENPANFGAWYELGWVESKASVPDAVNAFRQTIKIQPNFAPAYLDLGMLLYGNRKYADAIPFLQKAGDLGAATAIARNNLGICYNQVGRLPAAIASYKKALALDPGLAPAHLNLGFAYQQINKAAPAKAEYILACKLDQQFCKYAAPASR